jgi:hypothetical protein
MAAVYSGGKGEARGEREKIDRKCIDASYLSDGR